MDQLDDLRSEAELLRYSADRSFGGFLRGQLILGFAYGVIVLIAFLILGLPFAVLLAVSSGLLMVIPFFGAIIATFPPVLVALTQSLELAVGTFIAVAVIQNVMTNFVGPRLMAQTVGIHPLLVFAALLVGARVAGLWGVFLALPIAGILNVFARYALEVASGRRARTEASRMLSEREQRRARHEFQKAGDTDVGCRRAPEPRVAAVPLRAGGIRPPRPGPDIGPLDRGTGRRVCGLEHGMERRCGGKFCAPE